MGWTAEDVYETLTGMRVEELCVPGVEDAFAVGSPCDLRYTQMLEAYERLREKLSAGEHDTDAEIIIDSLLVIQQELCLKMFEYGFRTAQKMPRP